MSVRSSMQANTRTETVMRGLDPRIASKRMAMSSTAMALCDEYAAL